MLIWSSCKNYVSVGYPSTLDIEEISPDHLIEKIYQLKNKYPSETALFCTLDHRQDGYGDCYAVYIDEWRKPTLAEKKEAEKEKALKDESWRKYREQQFEQLKKELGYE